MSDKYFSGRQIGLQELDALARVIQEDVQREISVLTVKYWIENESAILLTASLRAVDGRVFGLQHPIRRKELDGFNSQQLISVWQHSLDSLLKSDSTIELPT